MITRRGFLIATASAWATGICTSAGIDWLAMARAARGRVDAIDPANAIRTVNTIRSVNSLATIDTVDTRSPDAAADAINRAMQTVLVIDERFVDLRSPHAIGPDRLDRLDRLDRPRNGSPVIYIDSDAGALWHRALLPMIAPDGGSLNPARRITSIDGWTSHADWFVLSTFAAAYGTSSRTTARVAEHDGEHGARHGAGRDAIAWHIDL